MFNQPLASATFQLEIDKCYSAVATTVSKPRPQAQLRVVLRKCSRDFFATQPKAPLGRTDMRVYCISDPLLFSCPFPLASNLCLKRCFLWGLLPLTWPIFHFCQSSLAHRGGPYKKMVSQVLRLQQNIVGT